jgi:uncharacterized protein with HEPN domain
MPRDYRVSLDDILAASERIQSYTHELTLKDFAADPKTFDAVVRNLEVIGEAVKNLPEDVRARCPQVAWKKIIGLRDVLIHQYFGIDSEILWDIVENKIPSLQAAVRELFKDPPQPSQ